MRSIHDVTSLHAVWRTVLAAVAMSLSAGIVSTPALSQGVPAKLTPVSGSGQSTTVNTQFPNPLKVIVQDASNATLAGVAVTFTAPAGTASSTPTTIFNGVSNTITVTTDASGTATVPASALHASQKAAGYTVAASAGSAATTLLLINAAGPAATISVSSGASQQGTVATDLPLPFTALVVDSFGNPAPGVGVTFSAPSPGPSGNFSGSLTALTTTDINGLATSSTFSLNTISGVYNVTANTTSAALPTAANFNLVNLPGAPTQISISQGSTQSAQVSTAFATLLKALVKDANNNPVPNASVTFTVPASGASATFAGGVASVTVLTDATGFATTTTLTANTTTGNFNVVATFSGGPTINFALTNTPGAATNIAVQSGNNQSATITLNFASNLSIIVTDAIGNPVPGTTVTFAAPGSGASGTFGGSATTTATTNASGIATATTFKANAFAGSYTITVTFASISTTFTLTNLNPSAITANGGATQSATITTAFGTLLSAKVTDAGGTGIAGLVVTFTAPASGVSGTFGGSPTTTATTNASGIATASAFTANATAGAYVVSSSVTGVAATGDFNLTNNNPSNIAVQAGNNQSATTSTAFPALMSAKVTDGSGNGIAGLIVTFAAPGSGASGAFGGSVTTTATTNASGIATASAFTANATTGAYTVNAMVTGVATPASFSLTNLAPAAATVTASPANGTPQSTAVNAAFGTALGVLVKDLNGQILSNYPVTFTVIASGGAGATFAGGVTATTLNTNASGIVTAPVLTANGTAGTYTVTAVAGGVTFTFTLTNTAPASISAITGLAQTTLINTNFGTQLQVTVRDASSNPVSGATVTFTAPGSGASGLFGGSATTTAVTNASGIATASVITANATTGAFIVSASVSGVASMASFNLTNTAPASIATFAGTPQSTVINTNFSTQLQAKVLDASNNPVAGAVVNFTAPGSGASGTFGGATTTTAVTNASGVAIASAFTANATTGAYTVTASVSGVVAMATYSLNNTLATPSSAVASPSNGTPQSTALNTAFPNALGVLVRDSGGAIIVGIPVTFTVNGAGGAAATFAGGGLNFTVNTDATGTATAPTLTANGTAGIYTVTATVGLLNVTFTLSNTSVPAKITATAGNNQSATISTGFVTALQATVLDASNNPVVGAVVIFTAPSTGANATFGGNSTATVTTNASGIATAPAALAGTVGGSYPVTATVQGTAVTASFTLTNTSGVPSTITIVSGNAQSSALGANFALPMVAVVKDASGNPIAGASVTFSAPTIGVLGTFAGAASATVTTDATGNATSPVLTAAGSTGGFTVTAKVNGSAATVNFTQTNTTAVPGSVAAQGGSGQATVVNTNFATVLQAIVTDTLGTPSSGITVTFSVPASGASGTFAGATTATAVTNAAGVATSPVLKANTTSGTFFAQATVTGIVSPALYTLTNIPGSPVGIAILSGTPQSTIVNTAFAAPLVAQVKDVYGNLVPGASVKFLAPTVGSVAAFPGAASTMTVTSDSSGNATSPALTANTIAGTYTVSASIATGTIVNFNLTNTPAPTSITATGASTQTTPVTANFGSVLQVVVKDASGLPVPGAAVTFVVPASGASATLSATTVTTNAAGIAGVNATANTTVGNYAVVASVAGVATPVTFNLTNTAGAAASIVVSGGSTQSTLVSTPFGTALLVTVKDGGNNPVPGVTVTYTAPASGATATLSSTTAVTNAAGVASVTVTANATAGAYTVTAKAAGIATSVNFSLTNTGTAGLQLGVTASVQSFSMPGQTIVFSYALRNTGTVAITGLVVTDNKITGISCPATSIAPAASMICTASYMTTASDVTTGRSITSVATAAGTTAVGAVLSATITTPIGIDVNAIRQKTVDANRGLMQNRAQAVTSMAPNAERLHQRLTAPMFGSADPGPEVPSEYERHEPMKLTGTPQSGGGLTPWPSILGGSRGVVPGLSQPSANNGVLRGVSGLASGSDADASAPNGSRTSQALPFTFGGSADQGTGNFNFATSLSQMRAAAQADGTAKFATGGQPGGGSARGRHDDVLDVWFEGQSSYFTSNNLGIQSKGQATVLYSGIDAIVARGVSVGFLVQRDWISDTSSVLGQSRDGAGWMAGPYVGLRLTPNIYIDARYEHGTAVNHVDPIGAYTDTFTSTRDLGSARLTGDWKVGAWQLRPSADVTYYSETQKSYINQVGISIPETKLTLGRATLGPEVGYKFAAPDNATFEPYVGLKGVYDFTGNGQTTASGASSSPSRLTGRVEIGATYKMDNGVSVRASGSYDGMGSDSYHAKQGQAFIIVPLH